MKKFSIPAVTIVILLTALPLFTWQASKMKKTMDINLCEIRQDKAEWSAQRQFAEKNMAYATCKCTKNAVDKCSGPYQHSFSCKCIEN